MSSARICQSKEYLRKVLFLNKQQPLDFDKDIEWLPIFTQQEKRSISIDFAMSLRGILIKDKHFKEDEEFTVILERETPDSDEVSIKFGRRKQYHRICDEAYNVAKAMLDSVNTALILVTVRDMKATVNYLKDEMIERVFYLSPDKKTFSTDPEWMLVVEAMNL